VGAQETDHLVLSAIGVLKLVDQDEAEAPLICIQPVGMFPKKPERVQ
jgi:hypothetical protein